MGHGTTDDILPGYHNNGGKNIPMTLMINSATLMLAIKGEIGTEGVIEVIPEYLRMFKTSAFASVGENGYPSEDIGYGTVMAVRIILLGEVYRRAGMFDYHQYCPHLLKFPEAMLHFTQPRGQFLSNTGDHGDDFGEREFPLALIARALENDRRPRKDMPTPVAATSLCLRLASISALTLDVTTTNRTVTAWS